MKAVGRQRDFELGFDHFLSRTILQVDGVCTQEIYDKCFSKCPPQIPGPPPPPESLKDYRRTWCTGHNEPWNCTDTNQGPEIKGKNPRLEKTVDPPKGNNQAAIITVSVLLPILLIIVVVVALLLRRKRNEANKNKTDNTYNLGYLSKPQAPTWTEHDPTEGAVEDGSEIFYQVDRSAAYTAGLNGVGNSRSVPDVVHSSSATLRKNSPNTPSVFDIGRSSSATSQAPLLSSPEIASHNKRRVLTRTGSGGQDTGESDLGSPLYTRYGATASQQPRTRKHSHEGITRGASSTTLGANSGYMTYTPSTKSHPTLYNGEKSDGTGTMIRTPKDVRQRSMSGDQNKPRPLRRPSGAAAAAVQRSDSMTLNRAAGRENYRNNWENFDEVTATMRRNKGAPAHRELVLGTDSFIDSFTDPEPEEATSVDQLGLPTRNPFLQGYYEYDDGESDPALHEETSFGQRRGSDDGVFRPDAEFPPTYDDAITPRRSSSVTMSQMPTLVLRAHRDRISEYDSEDSVEV